MQWRIRLWLLACAVGVCFAFPATAQVSTVKDAHLQFEVASVKLDRSGNGVRGGCHGIDSRYTRSQGDMLGRTIPDAATAPSLGRCVVTSARIGHLISIAWGLPMRLIEGEPDWGDGSDAAYSGGGEPMGVRLASRRKQKGQERPPRRSYWSCFRTC